MSLQVRRVVTGHDKDGHAVFLSDDVVKEGDMGCIMWTTSTSPANNNGTKDEGNCNVGSITRPGGTVFRIMEIDPHQPAGLMHRTNSVDYGLVLEGEVDLELDDKKVVHLKAGDVIIQRGTIHAWHFNSAHPTRIAWILVDAEPVKVDDKTLEPFIPKPYEKA